MVIVGMNRRHDGGVACVKEGRLSFSVEAQGDSNLRHLPLTRDRLQCALNHLTEIPDIIAEAGWDGDVGGYRGFDLTIRTEDYGGSAIRRFTCSHENAHLMCSYAMSPLGANDPCYALLWEGTIGALYLLPGDGSAQILNEPLKEPGHRFAFLFELASAEFPDDASGISMSTAGKLMALAGTPSNVSLAAEGKELLADLLAMDNTDHLVKSKFKYSAYYNIGVEKPEFRTLARAFSEAIFDKFYLAAKPLKKTFLPLVIAGGCGLNCDWNTKWHESGLFESVFVPPCTDDTGISIGAAAAAQQFYTKSCKIEWSVYAGEEFVHDCPVPSHWIDHPFDARVVAGFMASGEVIAWVQGRCEIGPRALGHRSLLASSLSKVTRDRLNRIKTRESYRPIAPVCSSLDYSAHFAGSMQNAHMLFFSSVVTPAIPAVTHADGSARVQVLPDSEVELRSVLEYFKFMTGHGVLCNTSLNFPGRGFINRMSDLISYVAETSIRGVVVGSHFYMT